MPKPKCFIAMPLTTSAAEAELYDDTEHWIHVMDHLFVPAVEAAGFEAIKPVAEGSVLIHASIVQHLQNADMVLCDLSSHNPNVFFELGVRTSVNKPVTLVRDMHTSLPFDTAGINTTTYDCTLAGWVIESERRKLAEHLTSSVETCGGLNPLWRQFGLQVEATQLDTSGDPGNAKLDLLLQKVNALESATEADRVTRGGLYRKSRVAGEASNPLVRVPMPVSAHSDLPEHVIAFFSKVGIFAEDDGTVPEWYYHHGHQEAAVSGEQLRRLPITSLRIIHQASEDFGIPILELPA